MIYQLIGCSQNGEIMGSAPVADSSVLSTQNQLIKAYLTYRRGPIRTQNPNRVSQCQLCTHSPRPDDSGDKYDAR
ncbi:MAG: hypothetical protein WA822_11490 [Albidovulum sp.]